MDYLTLKTHIKYLSERLSGKPIVIRAYDRSGRSIFLRLKTSDGIRQAKVYGCLSIVMMSIKIH